MRPRQRNYECKESLVLETTDGAPFETAVVHIVGHTSSIFQTAVVHIVGHAISRFEIAVVHIVGHTRSKDLHLRRCCRFLRCRAYKQQHCWPLHCSVPMALVQRAAQELPPIHPHPKCDNSRCITEYPHIHIHTRIQSTSIYRPTQGLHLLCDLLPATWNRVSSTFILRVGERKPGHIGRCQRVLCGTFVYCCYAVRPQVAPPSSLWLALLKLDKKTSFQKPRRLRR